MPSITIPLGSPDTTDILRGAPVEGDRSGSSPSLDGLLGGLEGVIPADVLDDLLSSVSANLTPEMIMTMARTKLRDLDEQITGILTSIQDTTKHTEIINSKVEYLQDIRRQLSEQGYENGEVYTFTPEQTAELERLGMPVGSETSITSLDGEIDRLRADIKEINSGTELLMMQVQTLTGQRANFLQIATSAIKKIDDSNMAIARNI